MVDAVDERDLDVRQRCQPPCHPQPAEPSADDDDPVRPASRRRRGRCGFHGEVPGYRTRADRAGRATSDARNCVAIVVSCLAPPRERLARVAAPDARGPCRKRNEPRAKLRHDRRFVPGTARRTVGGVAAPGLSAAKPLPWRHDRVRGAATVGSVRRGLRRVAATRRRTRRRRANRRGAMARPGGRGARLLRAAVRRVRPDEALRRRAAPPGRARGARRAPRRAADRARHAILRRRAGDQAAARRAVRPAAVRAAGARVGAAARAHRGGDPEPHRGPRVGRRVHPPGAGRDRSLARPRLPRPARFPLPQPGAVRVGRPGRAVDRGAHRAHATRSRPRRPAPSYCCPTAASCNSPPQRSWPKASASRSSRSARRTTS